MSQLLEKVHRVESAISSAEAMTSGAQRQLAAQQQQQQHMAGMGREGGRAGRSPARWVVAFPDPFLDPFSDPFFPDPFFSDPFFQIHFQIHALDRGVSAGNRGQGFRVAVWAHVIQCFEHSTPRSRSRSRQQDRVGKLMDNCLSDIVHMCRCQNGSNMAGFADPEVPDVSGCPMD